MLEKATEEALLGSIEKWKQIEKRKGADKGVTNCPLCGLFFNEEPMCQGCPVRADTNKPLCQGTPYINWYDHQRHHLGFHQRHHLGFEEFSVRCDYCRLIARDEKEYLQDLYDRLLREK
jgi:uncharacterized C2H2 Zn-finger protein